MLRIESEGSIDHLQGLFRPVLVREVHPGLLDQQRSLFRGDGQGPVVRRQGALAPVAVLQQVPVRLPEIRAFRVCREGLVIEGQGLATFVVDIDMDVGPVEPGRDIMGIAVCSPPEREQREPGEAKHPADGQPLAGHEPAATEGSEQVHETFREADLHSVHDQR
jgi:hypothetical protein